MKNIFKYAVAVAKVASVITGLSAYSNLIPPQYAPLAVLVFAIASASKEVAEAVEKYVYPVNTTNPAQSIK